MKQGLIIIGHGSRSQDAVAAFFQVVDMVREKSDFQTVEGAFMEISLPSIQETVEKVVQTGVSEIMMVPFFLYDGMHIKVDIPEIISELVRQYPDVKLKLARPIGPEPMLADILIARALAVK